MGWVIIDCNTKNLQKNQSPSCVMKSNGSALLFQAARAISADPNCEWAVARCLQFSTRHCAQPGTLQLRFSRFVTCRAYILTGAINPLLHAKITVLALKHPSGILLPKDTQMMYFTWLEIRMPLFCLSCHLNQNGKLLSYVSSRKQCQDNTLAWSLPLELVESYICTTFRGQYSFVYNLQNVARLPRSVHGASLLKVPLCTLQLCKD